MDFYLDHTYIFLFYNVIIMIKNKLRTTLFIMRNGDKLTSVAQNVYTKVIKKWFFLNDIIKCFIEL